MLVFRPKPFFVLLVSLYLGACVTAPAPIEDYVFAREAIEAAKAVDASKHAPAQLHQAEEAFRKAKIFYDNREYEEARDSFLKARRAAERAENAARLARAKSGEVM